jgi:hypothetical protein
VAAAALLSATGVGLWAVEPPYLVGALGVGLVGGVGLQAALSGEEGARRRAPVLALLALGMAGAGGLLDPGLWLAGLGPLVAALLVGRRP